MKEALKHWSGAFGKLSAKEFFSAVDVDNDGEITQAEFIKFWKDVHLAGNDEEEIMIELENLKNGEAWVGFDNVRQNQASARSQGSARKFHKQEDSNQSGQNSEQSEHSVRSDAGVVHVKFSDMPKTIDDKSTPRQYNKSP